MKLNRRSFLKSSALASSSLLLPNFLQEIAMQKAIAKKQGKVLVVIQLSGGNDGLNTIIPFENDIYYNKRPKLNISKSEVIKLDKGLGFNPAMKALQGIYDEGLMTIINSVGYPNPDRSHFRSMDIWQSASSADDYWSTGWIGRFLDSDCYECKPVYTAIEVDESLSLAMKGQIKSGLAVRDPKRLKQTSSNKYLKFLAEQYDDQHAEPEVAYLYKTMIETQSSAKYIFEKSQTANSKITYPLNPFAKDLKMIAELITADTGTKVYYTSLGGFDTHAGQKNKQNRLLKTYAETMAAFIKDLKSNDLLKDTLIMTFSEFGRRVKQNASGGTDHGTANNLFLMGGNLKKAGVFNEGSNLNDLDNGDLKYEIDFRNIYADILENWLETKSNLVLKKEFNGLGLI